jgi:hypothetical protein
MNLNKRNMEILEYVSENEIAILINLSDLIEQGNCNKNGIKSSDYSLGFTVNGNPYFSYFEIEKNMDETFDLIFYLERRYGLDIVDLETSIPRESLKKIVEERIFGI